MHHSERTSFITFLKHGHYEYFLTLAKASIIQSHPYYYPVQIYEVCNYEFSQLNCAPGKTFFHSCSQYDQFTFASH